MDIYKLRSFVMVARLGHLTKAAEALHVTQPAVTAQIKGLEQELGIALFTRSPGKIELTKAGEMLRISAERILGQVDDMLVLARQIKGEVVGNVVIGTMDEPDFLRLGGLLAGLHSALPLLQLHTQHMLAEDVLDGLANGSLNAGFVIGEVRSPDLMVLPLRSVTYRVVAPHQFSERLSLASWHEVAALPWIAAPKRSHLFQMQNQLFARQGVQPNVAVVCDQISAANSLVRSGLGMTLMREDQALAARELGELTIWSHAKIDAQLSFVYRHHSETDPATIGMVSILREVWQL